MPVKELIQKYHKAIIVIGAACSILVIYLIYQSVSQNLHEKQAQKFQTLLEQTLNESLPDKQLIDPSDLSGVYNPLGKMILAKQGF